MKKILFQGDSITDAGRSREDNKNMGIGYPTLVAAELGFDCPNDYEFLNRGISGDRVVDIYARIKRDILIHKPDYMSILVGINDVWHNYSEAGANGVDAKKYEMIYDLLISEVKKELPDIKIMILEPFVLRVSAMTEQWDEARAEVEKRAEKSREIAKKHNLKFVPLLEKFDAAAKIAPANHWLIDGVHPASAGHELIKREWIKAFNEIKAE